MFIYRVIKHYKEIWRVEDRARSGSLESVRAETAIKTVRERIRRNPLWKQKIMSPNWTYRPSSGTIYTWECPSAQTDASLLLLWRQSDGQEQNVSSSGTSRAGTKTSSSWTRKCSPSKSSITTSTTRFMLKRPLRCVLRVQVATTLPTSWFDGGCRIRGWHLFTFARKMWQLVSDCIKGTCYKELWNILTWLSSVVRNGSSSRTQFLPTRPDDLGVAAGNVQAFISAEDWPSGSPDLNPLDYKLWAVFEDMTCRKRHNNLDGLKWSLVKATAEIPL